jgi:hypothetical protein
VPTADAVEARDAAASRQAVKQALARQNARATQSPGAVGPIGRTVLLVTLFALAALIAVWLLLAF